MIWKTCRKLTLARVTPKVVKVLINHAQPGMEKLPKNVSAPFFVPVNRQYFFQYM